MKIRSVTMTMVSLVAIGLLASDNAAAGLTTDQLSRAGFDCFQAGPNNWTHCLNFTSFGRPAVRVLVFSTDGNVFLGTEQLLRADRYRGQPCPQDGLDMWDAEGVPGYFACHHFET